MLEALLEKGGAWKRAEDSVKDKLAKLRSGFRNDQGSGSVKEAHKRLGHHIERGFIKAGDKNAVQDTRYS